MKKGNAKLYVSFAQHFHMDVVYTTTRKYLADRMTKQLIRKYQSEPLKNYKIMRGRSLADPSYWMLKRKSTSRLQKHCLLPIYCFMFFVIVGNVDCACYIYIWKFPFFVFVFFAKMLYYNVKNPIPCCFKNNNFVATCFVLSILTLRWILHSPYVSSFITPPLLCLILKVGVYLSYIFHLLL